MCVCPALPLQMMRFFFVQDVVLLAIRVAVIQMKFLLATGTVRFVEVVYGESAIDVVFVLLHLESCNTRRLLNCSFTRRALVRCLVPAPLL